MAVEERVEHRADVCADRADRLQRNRSDAPVAADAQAAGFEFQPVPQLLGGGEQVGLARQRVRQVDRQRLSDEGFRVIHVPNATPVSSYISQCW